MTPAKFPSEVAQRILALLNDSAVTLFGNDYQVLYGDQSRIGITPTVCVEAGGTGRDLAGVPSRVENIHVCYIIIYWAKVDSNQQTKLDSERCGEAVVALLDQNLTLERNGDGGIVIHGFVTSIEPGYRARGQQNASNLYYAVRLTWTGKTKTMLGA